MRVLVFGGTGLVGLPLVAELRLAGHEVTAPLRGQFDIARDRLTADLLAGHTAAVNAAVVKDPAAADALAVNVDFPHRLAEACRRDGLALLHLSSDGVFAATAGPCDETHRPDAVDGYGRQKAQGEPDDATVVRMSVIGPEGRGFTGLMAWTLRHQGPRIGYQHHLWNGLTSPHLARALVRMMENGLPGGVRHLHADDTTKADLIRGVLAAFGRSDPVQLEAGPHRVRDQRLTTCYGQALAALAIPPIAAQLAELPRFSDGSGCWSRHNTGEGLDEPSGSSL